MKTMHNQFLSSIRKGDTFTENIAVSNSTTGDNLVDQFGKAGSSRGRTLAEVFADMTAIWAVNPLSALRLIFYIRLITRIIKGLWTTEEPQRGQGNRDEAFKRMLWVAKYHPNTFYANMWLIPVIGSWKDLFELMYYDLELQTNAIDRKQVYEHIRLGLASQSVADLVAKYLPRVQTTKNTTTSRARYMSMFAKELTNYLKLNAKQYRIIKSAGTAHTWQQQITKGLFDSINFNLISGKALFKLINSKFLTNNKLEEKYLKWIITQPVAKFTGYVFELGAKVGTKMSLAVKHTIDRQFEGLVQLAQKGTGALKGNIFVAIDTSSSMDARVASDVTTAKNVAMSLGVFFSHMIKGAFQDYVILFSHISTTKKLVGSFSDMYQQTFTGACPGNTDFQSCIDAITRLRYLHPNIPESDFPEMLLVVSDMQFDNPGYGYGSSPIAKQEYLKTNYNVAVEKLSKCFSPEFVSKFRFVWWVVTDRNSDFPQTIDEPGGYILSGFDGSILSFLFGENTKKDGTALTMEEAVDAALSQEVLLQLVVKD